MANIQYFYMSATILRALPKILFNSFNNPIRYYYVP